MTAPKVPVAMYDSVDAHEIPSTRVVAGYIDGAYCWTADDWDLFKEAVKITITVKGNVTANVADVENGDLTPLSARQWVVSKQQAGHRGATLYCGRASLPAVRAACHGLDYYVWVADWTGEPHPVEGTVATQYKSTAHYDESEVYSQEWLHLMDEVNRPWLW